VSKKREGRRATRSKMVGKPSASARFGKWLSPNKGTTTEDGGTTL